MFYFSLLIIFLLSCCGKTPLQYIDPVLLPYIQQFQQDATIHTANTSGLKDIRQFIFDTLPAGIAGECLGYTEQDGMISESYEEIHISIDKWKTLEETVKVGLIYHELGHCLYRFAHSDNLQSIMYKDTHSFSNWDESVNEFFEGAPHVIQD